MEILRPSSFEKLEQLDNLIAVDIETNGTKAHDLDCRIVGVGFADHSHIFYVPVDSVQTMDYILKFLETRELLGYNIYFDAAFLHREYSRMRNASMYGPGQKWLNWKWDIYAFYKNLASEGAPGQEWGLKAAQSQLLGWTEVGDVELGRWLVENGHVGSHRLEYTEGFYRYSDDGVTKWGKPDKSKMYLAPADILGYYCGLDAASTYMLHVEILLPALHRLPEPIQWNYTHFHQKIYWTTVKWHIEQQFNGLRVDAEKLQLHANKLQITIEENRKAFLEHPDVAPYIAEYNAAKIAEIAGKEPPRYRKVPERKPNSKKPPKPPVESVRWLQWYVKLEENKKIQHFNLDSGKQREWLFYEKLGYPVLVTTENGNPATDKKAAQAWGEPGELLEAYNEAVKELGYVQKCLDIQQDGLVHLQFNMVGTVTGRLSGTGGFSIQQQPKSRGYMECFLPSEGMSYVECDVNALEAVVLAELSKDKTMRYLYHPDSPKQDIYLFVGSFLPGIGEHIRKAGYNPDKPTQETIDKAKKEAKKYRQIAKACALGFQYNMGPKKLRQTLALQGTQVTEEEAFEIYKAYWKLFAGIKDYARWAEDQWRLRGGWVPNGIGLPTPVFVAYTSDIVNRIVQSTGHQILMWINWRLYELREELQLPFFPAIIDWHDATMVECPTDIAPQVKALFDVVYKDLNEWLGGDLPIKGSPQVAENLSEVKCE